MYICFIHYFKLKLIILSTFNNTYYIQRTHIHFIILYIYIYLCVIRIVYTVHSF